jgi:hypothetical protein
MGRTQNSLSEGVLPLLDAVRLGLLVAPPKCDTLSLMKLFHFIAISLLLGTLVGAAEKVFKGSGANV